jgi:hypothetical protein
MLESGGDHTLTSLLHHLPHALCTQRNVADVGHNKLATTLAYSCIEQQLNKTCL